MKNLANRIFLLLAIAVIAVAAAVIYKAYKPKPVATAAQSKPVTKPADKPATRTVVEANSTPQPKSMDSKAAEEAFTRGMNRFKANDVLGARDDLSEAILSRQLDAADEAKAIEAATDIAAKTILSPQIAPDDPYCRWYTVKAGDHLVNFDSQFDLRVDYRFIMRINNITDAGRLSADQKIKLVQGPFHAVVSKSNFTLDLYLQREGLPKVFVKRLRVGLGKQDGTPVGDWKLMDGKKLVHANWNRPVTNETIRWGQPDYPLGKEGYWIGLRGVDDNTRAKSGYGIHGTNDPDSIGKDASLGCIRMADDDIELVFQALHPDARVLVDGNYVTRPGSTVKVVP